jgi:hypothetical protein
MQLVPTSSISDAEKVTALSRFGAKCDGRTTSTPMGTINASSTTLTTTAAFFQASDVGKYVVIGKNGHTAAISAYVSTTQVTLATAPSAAALGAYVTVGTNDTAAMADAMTAAKSAGGMKLLIPGICIANTVITGYGVHFVGNGPEVSKIFGSITFSNPGDPFGTDYVRLLKFEDMSVVGKVEKTSGFLPGYVEADRVWFDGLYGDWTQPVWNLIAGTDDDVAQHWKLTLCLFRVGGIVLGSFNTITFDRCRVSDTQNARPAIEIRGSQATTPTSQCRVALTGVTVEGNTGVGILFRGMASMCSIENCHFEANVSYDLDFEAFGVNGGWHRIISTSFNGSLNPANIRFAADTIYQPPVFLQNCFFSNLPSSGHHILLRSFIGMIDQGGNRPQGGRAELYDFPNQAMQFAPNVWYGVTEDSFRGGVINVRRHGATGKGIADDTAAIQEALAVSQSFPQNARPEVYFPAGIYLVSSTLNVTADYMRIRGEGWNSSLLSRITNGTAVLKVSNGNTSAEISDLFILANDVDEALYATNAGNAKNCIGLEASGVTRFRIHNVQARNLKVGFKIDGFIAELDFYAYNCETGFIGTLLNSVKVHPKFENCRKDFAINSSNGLEINAMLAEGGIVGSISSTLDSSHNVKITTPYWEWTNGLYGAPALRSQAYLTVGGTSLCYNVSVENAEVVAGEAAFQTAVYPIVLDRLQGVHFDGVVLAGTQRRPVKTTLNTKDLELVLPQSGYWPQDGSLQVGTPWNYFPNRNFDLWFRGWTAVLKGDVTTSHETTIVRRGKNAVRVTANAGTSYNRVLWQLSGSAVSELRGKRVRAGAWVWIPNISAFDESVAYNGVAHTMLPDITMTNIGGGGASSAPVNTTFVRNAWNYFSTELDVDAVATGLYISVYVNDSPITPDGTEYIVVDSITLCEANVPYRRQFADETIDSPLIESRGTGNRLEAVASAAPTDTAQSYVVGDCVRNSDPTVTGNEGWVCVVAGSPGIWTKLDSVVNVRMLGATGNGITNDSAAIIAARDIVAAAPAGQQPELYFPAGRYFIGTTQLLFSTSLRICGDGSYNSVIVSSKSDGTSAVKFAPGTGLFGLKSIRIEGDQLGNNYTAYMAGSGSMQNAIGLEAYDLTSFPNRFRIEDVAISGFQKGARIGGFIADIDLFLTYCHVGLEGTLLNDVTMNFRSENVRQDFAITNSKGLRFLGLMAEGSCASSISSTLDDCRAVTILSAYYEWGATYPRTQPFLTVGGTTYCYDFNLLGLSVGTGASFVGGVYPLKLDRVNYALGRGVSNPGTQGRLIQTTTNCKEVDPYIVDPDGTWQQDGSKLLSPAFNYMPNSNFDLWFRGWNYAGTYGSAATISQETTIVRRGQNAVRVTANAGSTDGNVMFQLTGDNVAALRGKTIRFGAWVWIPNHANFDELNETVRPGVLILSNNGATSTTSGTNNNLWVRNEWGFFTCEMTVQSDATTLYFFIYVNFGGSAAAGTEFIVVDSISVVEERVNVSRQMRGEFEDHDSITSVGIGNRMVKYASAAPSSDGQTYVVGDFVRNPDPTVTGNRGWICVAAGSPGTWAKVDSTVNVRLLGAKGDWNGASGTDDTAAIQAALSTGLDVYIPRGVYSVTRLFGGAPGQRIFGDGWGDPRRYNTLAKGTCLISAIADGTSILTPADQPTIENICITGIYEGFNSQNATALNISECHAWTLRNVAVRMMLVGLKANNSWVGTATNFMADGCGTGIIGSQLNDVQFYGFHGENSVKPFAITDSTRFSIEFMSEVGGAVASGTLDNCTSFEVKGYFELASVSLSAPFLVIGGTSYCYDGDVKVWGISLTDGSLGVPLVKIVRLDGGEVRVLGSGPANKRNFVSIDENYALNVRRSVASLSGEHLPHPSDASAGNAVNWFPDPFYDIAFPTLVTTNCAYTTSYNEMPQGWNKSLILTATLASAASAFAVQTINLTDYPYLTKIFDQHCLFGYWVKVDAGNTFYADGSPGPYAYMKALPSGQVSVSETRSFVIGDWRFVCCEMLVPYGTTSFEVYRHVNPTGVAATANTVARFGPCILVPAGYVSPRAITRKLANGEFSHHARAMIPKAQPVPAAATDAASTQALANSLRTALINLGLGV